MNQKLSFEYVIVTIIKKNHLDTTQATFSKNNYYYRGNIGENKNKSSLKMHLFRGISPKCVLTPKKESAVIF